MTDEYAGGIPAASSSACSTDRGPVVDIRVANPVRRFPDADAPAVPSAVITG
ncbi:hypothetical protein [Streptomyces sp. NPDC005262]|uniref:hypothetical protein n=1 Tax=Streptomyces sp. NPDC005262 TaxID=3364710 RepID=UPI0036B1B5C7